MEKDTYKIELTLEQVNIVLGCLHYSINNYIDDLKEIKYEEFIKYKEPLIDIIETHNIIAKECNKPRQINLTIIGE